MSLLDLSWRKGTLFHSDTNLFCILTPSSLTDAVCVHNPQKYSIAFSGLEFFTFYVYIQAASPFSSVLPSLKA